ncbi:MAG: tetratricopeptide repeat protein, partial [Thermoanaerobaculia bacterium]
DYSLALPLQARAQTLAPDSDRHAIRLARTLAALGRPGDVRQVLRNIRKRGMFEPEAWLLLGEACLALGDGPCAASALGRLGRLVPGPLLPWLRSGPPGGQGGRRIVEILALAGRLGEALSLREARDGPAEAADFYRVLLLPEAGRRAAALTGARALLARGDAGAARSALEPLYRSYPVDLEVSLTYAEISAHLADDEEVREILTRLAERLVGGEGPPFVPELRLEDRQRATEILTRTGGASWQRLVYSNALHAYGLGAFLVPDDPRPHYNLGLAWERTGDYGDALRAFDRTLALSPDFPRAREHRQAMAHATRRPAGGAAR